MKIGKKNKVSTNIFNFNIGLIGEGGVGKTTTIYNVLEKICPDGYLMANCGHEDGHSSIEGIVTINIVDWNSDYDEETNSIGFATLVDDICENKASDYPNLVTIAYDVYDELVNIAQKEVIRLHNRQHPEKPVKSIKACFGGFMAGEDMANQMIIDGLWRLKQVGVSFIIIGHLKTKEQTDVVTGETYSILTTDMSNRDFNVIKNKLDILGVAYIDRSIIREKSKKNEKKTVGKIKDESRKIKFRSDDYSMDSKSRFADIVSEINLDADEFIDAIQNAINAELNKNGVDIKSREKEDLKRVSKREKDIAEREKISKEISDIVSKIREFTSNNKDNKDAKPALLSIANYLKEHDIEKISEIPTKEDAEAILALCVLDAEE